MSDYCMYSLFLLFLFFYILFFPLIILWCFFLHAEKNPYDIDSFFKICHQSYICKRIGWDLKFWIPPMTLLDIQKVN